MYDGSNVCGKKGCRGYVDFGIDIKMCGGRHVRLCNNCRNDWHEFVTAHTLFEKLEQAALQLRRIEAATMGGASIPREDWNVSYADRKCAERELFDLSGEWLEQATASRSTEVTD